MFGELLHIASRYTKSVERLSEVVRYFLLFGPGLSNPTRLLLVPMPVHAAHDLNDQRMTPELRVGLYTEGPLCDTVIPANPRQKITQFSAAESGL